MRTISDATLYTVIGPRGTHYAVRNHDTGEIWTERTELAAAALGNEHNLVIVEREEIPHHKLLDMMAARAQEEQTVGAGAGGDSPGGGLSGLVRRFVSH